MKIAVGAGVGGFVSGVGLFLAMRIAIAKIETDIEWIKEAIQS